MSGEKALVQRHLDTLGHTAVDKVSGISGVIDSICFDLYGCVQASLRPQGADKDGNPYKGYWYDISRMRITSDEPVMQQPDFTTGPMAEGKKGPAAHEPRS